MSLPYEPEVHDNQEDYDGFPDGIAQVLCKHCGQGWPCADYQADHTTAQVKAQKRWVVRVENRAAFPDLIERRYHEEGIEPQDPLTL